jgi:adhesin/invasin
MRPIPIRRSIPRGALGATAAALFALGLACSSESQIGPGGVVAVRIVPETLHVVLFTTDTAHAFPLDADSAFLPSQTIAWQTGNTAIATVGPKGDVSGLALGTTTLQATSDGITGNGFVVVDPQPTMVFAPDTVQLTGTAGSPTAAVGVDNLNNGGGGAITGLTLDSITYVSGNGWLQATLNGTAAPTTVDVSGSPTGLGLGTYIGLIWFTSPTATPTTGSLPVKMILTAGAPTTVALQAGNGQTATVNSSVGVNPAVKVTDQFGNPVAGNAVAFAVTGGGGAIDCGAGFTAGCVVNTDAAGIAALVAWRLGTTAGANALSATAPGLAGSPVNFTATGVHGPASIIAVNAGNNQAATAGSAVAVPPSVIVTDQFANPVSGVGVTFAVSGGGGSITGPNQTTNASGIATVGSWTLGVVAGANTMTATSAGLTGSPVTFTATGNPGTAATIALAGGNNQTATVTTTLPTAYSVLVTDALSNPVQGVTVGWAAAAGGGSVNCGGGPVASCSSLTNVSGIATAIRTLGTVAGAQTATATVGGLAGSPVTFTATATAGTATQIAVSAGNNQTATVNTALATDPAALAQDAFGNPVPGVAITFTVTAGGGLVNCGAGNTSTCNATTNGLGVATVTSWIIGTAAGTNNNTLSATRSGATGTSFTASGTPGPVTTVNMLFGNNQTARPGATLPTSPSVTVSDAFGNAVCGATVTFSISGGGGSLTGGATTATCGFFGAAAVVGSWTLGSSGLPTVSAPANGRYVNNLTATSNGVSTIFTAFAAWSFASDVQGLFTTYGCNACHGFSTYASMVNVGSSCGGSSVYIAPSSLANSLIYQKIIPSGSLCSGGVRMPQGGPFMAQTEYDRIRDWILNGAPNN